MRHITASGKTTETHNPTIPNAPAIMTNLWNSATVSAWAMA